MVSYLQTASNIALPVLYGIYNVGQAVATHKAVQDSRFLQKLYRFQNLEVCSQITFLTWQALSIGKWIEATSVGTSLKSLFCFSRKVSYINDIFYFRALLGLGVISSVFFLSYKISHFVYKYFNSSDDLQQHLNQAVASLPQVVQQNVKLLWHAPSDHYGRMALYLSQSVVNICLIFIQSNPLLFATVAAAQLYSLAKAIQLKWLCVRRTIPVEGAAEEGQQEYTVSYLASIYPSQRLQEAHSCVICHDEASAPDAQFCSSHNSHLSCLTKWVCTISTSFSGAISNMRRQVVRNDGISIYQKSITYTTNFKKTALLSCPSCQVRPIQNVVEIMVKDRDEGKIKNISAEIRMIE